MIHYGFGMLQSGFPAVAEIHSVHNHSINTAASLLYLPATTECRQQFHDYFASGMCVSEAIKCHAGMLELQDNACQTTLWDASINPKYATVRWWFDQWRLHNVVTKPENNVNSVSFQYLYYMLLNNPIQILTHVVNNCHMMSLMELLNQLMVFRQ